MLDTIWHDVRHGVRLFRARPSLAFAGITSLALGIGASVSMFIIVNAALLRPLPVESPEELVLLFTGNPENPHSSLSYPDYRDYRDGLARGTAFRGLAAYGEISVSLASEDVPERVRGGRPARSGGRTERGPRGNWPPRARSSTTWEAHRWYACRGPNGSGPVKRRAGRRLRGWSRPMDGPARASTQRRPNRRAGSGRARS